MKVKQNLELKGAVGDSGAPLTLNNHLQQLKASDSINYLPAESPTASLNSWE